MIKNYVFKAVVMLVILAMGASPVMGAVCSMSCGDTRSCCCQGGHEDGALAYTAPDCCEDESRLSDESSKVTDRYYSTFSLELQAGCTSRTGSSPAAADSRGDDYARMAHQGPGSPPAPLFIVNSSFLI